MAYQDLANASAKLGTPPPKDLLARVRRAAERWRALEPQPLRSCPPAAMLCQNLGDEDAAWDYLTTPLAQHHRTGTPIEPPDWWKIAQDFCEQGRYQLAEHAFRTAAEAAPDNPQILWDRAQNLRQAGKDAEVRAIMRNIAGRDWGVGYQALRDRARKELEKEK
jgi:hypothetical protein